MTDEYAARRREYVAQIRSSFDNGAEDVISNETEERTASAFSFGKLRFGAAMVFLFFFLVNWYTDGTIFNFSVTEIIDIVTDNHYYTNLQDYVMMLEEL